MELKKYNILSFRYNIKNLDYYKVINLENDYKHLLNMLWYDLHMFNICLLFLKIK